MWAGTCAHLAVASEHLSGRPQRTRAARRGERARPTRRGEAPSRAAPRRAPGSPRELPGPAHAPRRAPAPTHARHARAPAPRGARSPGGGGASSPSAASGAAGCLTIVRRGLTRGGWPGRAGGAGLVPGRTCGSAGP